MVLNDPLEVCHKKCVDALPPKAYYLGSMECYEDFPQERSLPYRPPLWVDIVCALDTITGNPAVITLFHHFEINERNEKVSLFSFFETLFYTKLPFPLPR